MKSDGCSREKRKKRIRSQSGIVNVSVVMPPHRFSCKYNCLMCPDQRRVNGADVDMPRSYLSNEDAVRRAADVGFDAIEQMYVRLACLETNGHVIDKIEIRVLGGTFSSYPHDVADAFIRDCYYGANTYYNRHSRPRETIEDEQERNETGRVRIVGLGLETRPDEITLDEIWRFRRYGCTRVELGVQHTDDRLLRRINRGHGVRHSIRAIRLMKDHGFKVEIHIMTDLPGSTPDNDKDCYTIVLTGEDLIPDYLKDYPCLAVDFTEIKKWREDGRWTPYSEDENGAQLLMDVLVYRQKITPPWVRVSRIQRDFAMARSEENGSVVLGYHSGAILSNLGQLVRQEAERRGVFCACIRCREIRDTPYLSSDVVLKRRSFMASGRCEYFLSMEIFPDDEKRRRILGFARLRICGHCAYLRELHIYGSCVGIGVSSSLHVQHRGYGRRLLRTAENIARYHACNSLNVISGIGVREYYRKFGYHLEDTYMVVNLWDEYISIVLILFLTCILSLLIIFVYRPDRSLFLENYSYQYIYTPHVIV